MQPPSSLKLRPGFPNGLQVLLLEDPSSKDSKVVAQLKELQYVAIPTTSCTEAMSLLSSNGATPDIIVAEASLLDPEDQACKAFMHAAKGLPLLLMSEGAKPNDVWKGLQLGAVDFLERPLSTLKLRNIWQHVVRQMLQNDESEDCTSSRSGDALAKDSLTPPRTPSATSSGGEAGGSSFFCKALKSEGDSSLSGNEARKDSAAATAAASSGSDAATADSLQGKPSSNAEQPRSKATKRCAKESPASATAAAGSGAAASRPPLAIRPGWAAAPPVMGPMVPVGPGQWAPAMPPMACVWGTPYGVPAGQPGFVPQCMGKLAAGAANPQAVPPPSVGFGAELPRCTSTCSFQTGGGFSLSSDPSDMDLSLIDCSDAGLDQCLSIDSLLGDLLGGDEKQVGGCGGGGVFGFGGGLFGDVDPKKAPLPIGLNLRKSASFLELLNERLYGTAANMAAS